MNLALDNGRKFTSLLRGVTIKRGMVWGIIILAALVAFEIFNYSTTEYALRDVLGDLRFIGLRWSTILALAFCGIDFAGIARLFTPEQGRNEPAEVWYLFSAWLLAAGMNATLTWWGVSVAISSHSSLSAGTVVSAGTLTRIVPVFVAVMVWLIRVLIIGTFSVGGEKLFTGASSSRSNVRVSSSEDSNSNGRTRHAPVANPFRPAPKTARSETVFTRSEPVSPKVSVSAMSARDSEYVDTPRFS